MRWCRQQERRARDVAKDFAIHHATIVRLRWSIPNAFTGDAASKVGGTSDVEALA